MKKHAAAACVAALLISSVAAAQSTSGNTTTVTSTDPVTGERTVRPATAAERAQIRAAMEGIQSSLPRLEVSLASLKGLEGSLASLKGLEGSLAGLAGFEDRIARLQRMVETETPVSTTTTSEGVVRVYRDGTKVIDSGGNRTFQPKN